MPRGTVRGTFGLLPLFHSHRLSFQGPPGSSFYLWPIDRYLPNDFVYQLNPAWHTRTQVYLLPLLEEGVAPKMLTKGDQGASGSPNFSEDGSRIAWLEMREGESPLPPVGNVVPEKPADFLVLPFQMVTKPTETGL